MALPLLRVLLRQRLLRHQGRGDGCERGNRKGNVGRPEGHDIRRQIIRLVDDGERERPAERDDIDIVSVAVLL